MHFKCHWVSGKPEGTFKTDRNAVWDRFEDTNIIDC